MVKPTKGKGKKRVKGRDYFSLFVGTGIILLVGVISFFLFRSAFEKEAPPKPPQKAEEKAEKKAPEPVPPPPVEEKEEAQPEEVPPAPRHKVRLAIVIDDMGAHLDTARTIAAIDPHITFAVMPHESQSSTVVREMARKGHDVILHLPMEPKDLARNNPGKGALLNSMSADDIRQVIENDLKLVPGVKGANNHMGSRFTEDREDMKIVMWELKKRKLFFLDSRTSPRSVGYETARGMGLRSASRDVFLDNTISEEHSRQQLKQAAELAKKKGHAIAIGHPHPSTIKVLQEMVPQLRKQGVEIVGVSRLVG